MQKRRGATQAEVPAASSLRSTMTSTPFSRARDQLGDAQFPLCRAPRHRAAAAA